MFYICMLIQVDIAAGGWHSTALTDEGEVSVLCLFVHKLLHLDVMVKGGAWRKQYIISLNF